MFEQLSIQTRFKHPYRRSSDGLATHTPYNPRRRLKTPEASERPSDLCANGEAEKRFHLPARQTWDIISASLRPESSRVQQTSQRRRDATETPTTEFCGTWSDDKAMTVSARGAP